MRTTAWIGRGFCLIVALLAAFTCSATEPNQIVLLWPNGAPGSEGKTGEEKVRIYGMESASFPVFITLPSLFIFLPKTKQLALE
jgi:hypothetical protein